MLDVFISRNELGIRYKQVSFGEDLKAIWAGVKIIISTWCNESPGLRKQSAMTMTTMSEKKSLPSTIMCSPWTAKLFLASLTHSIMQRHNINLHDFPSRSHFLRFELRGCKRRLQFDNSLKLQGFAGALWGRQWHSVGSIKMQSIALLIEHEGRMFFSRSLLIGSAVIQYRHSLFLRFEVPSCRFSLAGSLQMRPWNKISINNSASLNRGNDRAKSCRGCWFHLQLHSFFAINVFIFTHASQWGVWRWVRISSTLDVFNLEGLIFYEKRSAMELKMVPTLD